MTQARHSVNQTRSVLLTLMNDHEGLIIFTTNFIENYDPAFLRRILVYIKFNSHPCCMSGTIMEEVHSV